VISIGEVYMCGMSDEAELPEDPAQISYSEDSCKRLKEMAGKLSKELEESNIDTMQV
jgi:hypothetical protein